MIKIGRDEGFFVTYNHPEWSREMYPQYTSYHGMNAMEIRNYGCVIDGYDADDSMQYDDMLRNGERIFCIATDDNHNTYPEGTSKCDSFGGFTVIKAENLEYRSITSALEAGNFYASAGPQIYSLQYDTESGMIHIEFSPAARAVLSCDIRHTSVRYSDGDGTIESADFLLPTDAGYFRITVSDSLGKCAYTNAYFVADVLK